MDEKVYNKLMNLCEELEGVAVSYLDDVNICDIYNDRLYRDNKAYWILLQLCTISKFKKTIKSLRNYDMIVKGIYEMKGDEQNELGNNSH